MTTDNQCIIILNRTQKHLVTIETKEIYELLINTKGKRPTSEKKWLETDLLYITDEDWENIYVRAFKLTTDIRLPSFQFKITNHILACKNQIYIYGNLKVITFVMFTRTLKIQYNTTC